jgi:hypothetical protein
MARRKKPENETPEQAEVRRTLEAVADYAPRGEKVSWDRKMDNMVALLARLRPIEEHIIDLMAQKLPIIDEITALRREMVRDCVHPFTHLVHNEDGTVLCKFCNKTINVVEK